MRRRLSILLVPLAMLCNSTVVHAACSAANPSSSVLETTPDSSLANNGDGTVTHSTTGLMWKKCIEGMSYQDDPNCGIGDPSALTWAQALAASVASRTGGYSDWRVPNKKELESLSELCGYNPAINQNAFPATPADNFFWTSTTNPSFPNEAWMVSSGDGADGSDAKTSGHYVRLVRGGQAADSFDAFASPLLSAVGVSGTTATGTTLSATSNQTSTGYWIVVARDAAAPTAAQVKAGVNYGVVTVLAAGSGAMTAAVAKTFNVTGLAAGTAYDVYVVAENGSAQLSELGAAVQFTTASASAPAATTGAASALGQTGATLNGTVNDNGAATSVTFDYGLTIGYGTTVAADTGANIPGGSGSTPVAKTLTGLSCGSTYHFRVNASNGQGTTNGLDQSFATLACSGTVPGAPMLFSVAPGAGKATLTFSPPANNGGQPISGYIATCSATGQATRSMTGAASPVSVLGLKGGVQYSCSVAARNAIGTGPSSLAMTVVPQASKANGALAPLMLLLMD